MKQTFKQANYTYIKKLASGEHVVLNNSTMLKELFGCSKNYSGWGLVYKNTHLEFVRTMSYKELKAEGLT